MKKLFCITIVFVILLSGFKASAQEQRQPVTPTQPKEFHCSTDIVDFLAKKTTEFAEFIDKHFRNEKNTSDLVETAMKKFREHIKALREEVAKYPPYEKIAAEGAAERRKCDAKVEDELFIAKEILKSHIIANAQAKKTTRLLDKYKEINSRLDKLNYQIAQMYGYMQTFSKKLPCYTPQCN